MPRFNSTLIRAKVKVPSVFGEGTTAEWADVVGYGRECPRMMSARLAAHGQISIAFRRGTETQAVYEIASDLVALAAEGHNGLMHTVGSVYGIYCKHAGINNRSTVKAARLWNDAVVSAITTNGTALPPHDPCATNPRLTVRGVPR